MRRNNGACNNNGSGHTHSKHPYVVFGPLLDTGTKGGKKRKMKTKEEKIEIIKARLAGLEQIYGKERGNKCSESDYEVCYWDGYDKGYAAGYTAASAKTYIRGL